MAAADTARLVAQLTLDDKGFSRGINSAIGKSNELESTLSNVGRRAGAGLQSLERNLAVGAAVGIGAITVAVKGGLDDLAELENAVTSVDGAIEQLGLTGQLTGKQVADWANDIERDVDAAFDDKAITQSATTLLRYGKVTPKALRPALEVVTDLAAKTGDVESASELLAKALAAPEKAAGRLTRVGIILTKQQQDQIKAMTEAGDVAGAQALLLDAVAKSTEGAAKAMAGPYQDAINKTNDAVEDGRKALAVGFLPVITKVADKLAAVAADPEALASIEAFGKTLAGGLDDLISTAERLPWDAIGASLQLAGTGAKAVLEAFTSLPPWVQTAVLTSWGLNKLTGGALSGIVGELGKGLIKGVLGMNAGVVNINAATVNGVGGAPGAAAGGKGVGVGGAVAVATGAGVILTAQEITRAVTQGVVAAQTDNDPVAVEIAGNLPGIGDLLNPLERIQRALSDDFRSDLEVIQDLERQQVTEAQTAASSAEAAARASAVRDNAARERLDAIKADQAKRAAAIVASINPVRSEMIRVREGVAAQADRLSSKIATTNSELAQTRAAAAAAASSQKATTAAGLADVRGAIQRKNFAPKVTVNNQLSIGLSISVRDQIKQRKLFHSVFHHAE